MSDLVKLALPTGRMQSAFFQLLADAGIEVSGCARSYRPTISLEGFDIKVLKTQSIVEMLSLGKRDVGIAGLVWVRELDVEVLQLLDTELDPVRIVAAAPPDFRIEEYESKKMIIASEYLSIARSWVNQRKLDATVVRSYGTTEVFPPEDADCIIDNTSTGATLQASNLVIIDEIFRSSTRVFANPAAYEDISKRNRIEDLILVLQSVLEARQRVMLEINVSRGALQGVADILPCMRKPTIAELYGGDGFVVKAAVPKKILPTLIPRIKANGGTDIVVTKLSNVIP